MAQLAGMDSDSVLGVLGLLEGLLGSVVGKAVGDGRRPGEETKLRVLSAWCWGLLGKMREVGELGSEEVAVVRELGKAAVAALMGLKGVNVPHQGEDEDDEDEDEVEGNDLAEKQLPNQAATVTDEAEDLEAAKARLAARLATTSDSQPEFQSPPLPNKSPPPPPPASNHQQQPSLSKAPTPNSSETVGITNTTTNLNGELSAHKEPAENKSSAGKKDNGTIDADKQVRALLDMIIVIVGEVFRQRDLLEFREIWDEENREKEEGEEEEAEEAGEDEEVA